MSCEHGSIVRSDRGNYMTFVRCKKCNHYWREISGPLRVAPGVVVTPMIARLMCL